MEKLKSLLLYLATCCEDDERFSATKLNKLLFVIDFKAYALWGKPVTEATYIHLQYGPVPKQLVDARDELTREGKAVIETRQYHGREQHRLRALVKPPLGLFSVDELKLINAVVKSHASLGARDMSAPTHAFGPWQQTRMYEEIPYYTVFVLEREPVTLEDMEWGVKRVRELGLA